MKAKFKFGTIVAETLTNSQNGFTAISAYDDFLGSKCGKIRRIWMREAEIYVS